MTNNYIKQYELLHKVNPNYGMTSIKFYDFMLSLIKKYSFKSILDYGCGKSFLLDKVQKKLNIKAFKYDPAIKEYKDLPDERVDFVICTDVLQHIPIYDLDRVLAEIKKYSNNCFFHIRCTPYKTRLPNGDKANCTVYPSEWWKKLLRKYFNNIEKINNNDINSVSFIIINNKK